MQFFSLNLIAYGVGPICTAGRYMALLNSFPSCSKLNVRKFLVVIPNLTSYRLNPAVNKIPFDLDQIGEIFCADAKLSRQKTMLRRQARERRAYIHEKALAQKSNIANLRRLKAHIEKDKALPKDLQDPSLRKDLRFDEALLEEAEQLDDEYYNMGMREPRVLITTSRDPSSRLLQFSKV